MEFRLLDKSTKYTDVSGKRHRRRWIELSCVFKSPYCIISEKKYATWQRYGSGIRQIVDYQFRKTKKPQKTLYLMIQLEFLHFKKISENEILHRIGKGEGYVYFNNFPELRAETHRDVTIEISSDNMKRDLFLRRLLREKELGYY